MSDESPRSGYALVPVLTKDNFMKWEIQVRAYLTGVSDHVRVIRRTKDNTGKYQDPTPPTDDEDLKAWNKSERVAQGVIMATASDLHLELIHRRSEGPVWKMWTEIEAQHQQHDASLRHEAWMQLFAIRRKPSEPYIDLYRRVEAARAKIDRVTPADLTTAQRSEELGLFTIINALDIDDPLRRQLISQKDITLADAYSSFMRTDRGDALKTEAIESAHAALGSCFLCQSPEHFARDCPHREAIKNLVTNRNNGRGRGRGRGRGFGFGSGGASRANAASSSTSTTPNDNASTAGTQEVVGIATLLLSNESHVTDSWICDSGASCSMSGDHSAFQSLMADRRPIRLADGKVVYSKGLGPVRFLSDCGYTITIDNVLFVPRLSVNLFSTNRFAKEHCDSHSEVMEYPKRKWINRHTGAIEFTATIHTNNLAYMNWRVAPQIESTNISMEELHVRLNHLPFPAVRQLIRTKPIDGIPDRVTGTHPNSDFCEDCVNGKLTRAPHTHPATRADALLQRVFTDVHGPLTTQSQHGHFYWVSFVDDYSRFPAVYFIMKKSDVFAAFKRFRVWAENVTGR
jgi:hypothetical protein